eukprot:3205415-Pyramimonas_sp.AAC.1
MTCCPALAARLRLAIIAARARGRGPAVRVRRWRCDPLRSAKKVELVVPSKRCAMAALISQQSLHRAPCSAVVAGSWS